MVAVQHQSCASQDLIHFHSPSNKYDFFLILPEVVFHLEKLGNLMDLSCPLREDVKKAFVISSFNVSFSN